MLEAMSRRDSALKVKNIELCAYGDTRALYLRLTLEDGSIVKVDLAANQVTFITATTLFLQKGSRS